MNVCASAAPPARKTARQPGAEFRIVGGQTVPRRDGASRSRRKRATGRHPATSAMSDRGKAIHPSHRRPGPSPCSRRTTACAVTAKAAHTASRSASPGGSSGQDDAAAPASRSAAELRRSVRRAGARIMRQPPARPAPASARCRSRPGPGACAPARDRPSRGAPPLSGPRSARFA